MAKKKTKTIATFLVIMGILLVSFGGVGSFQFFFGDTSQQFAITSAQVYEPEFASLRCEETDRETLDTYYYVTGDPENPTTYIEDENGKLLKIVRGDINIECSRGVDKTYTNECLVEWKMNPTDARTSFGTSDYICDADATTDLDNCEDATGVISANTKNIWFKLDTISRNEVVVVTDFSKSLFGFDREFDRGDIVYRVSRDEYGLVSDAGGRIEVSNSCDLNDVLRISDKDILKIDLTSAENQGEVIGTRLDFGGTINYVIGFKPLLESKRIIDDGKFYTYGDPFKFPIVEGDSGRKYVDITNRISDTTIICDPASLYCIDDGRTIDEQFGVSADCDPSTDLIEGFVPYTQKENWIAERVCVGGEWLEVNPKPIPTCTGDTPVLNDDYVCVAGTEKDTTQPDDEGESYMPFYLLIGGIAMIGVARNLRGKE